MKTEILVTTEMVMMIGLLMYLMGYNDGTRQGSIDTEKYSPVCRCNLKK